VTRPAAPDAPLPDAPVPAAAGATPPFKRSPPKSARRRSREAAMQGLYEWLVAAAPVADIELHMRELDGFGKCDLPHFETLLRGCIEHAAELDALLAQHLDRVTARLSPVEHALLLIGAFELRHCMDVPYKVAINEAVELAKSFGGTDGHKYVNGVLDKAAAQLRPNEVQAARPR
jgi:transcription antitermination protein NusB